MNENLNLKYSSHGYEICINFGVNIKRICKFISEGINTSVSVF